MNSWTSHLPAGICVPIVDISPEGSSKRNRRGWSASHLGAGTTAPPGCLLSPDTTLQDMLPRRDTLAGTTLLHRAGETDRGPVRKSRQEEARDGDHHLSLV